MKLTTTILLLFIAVFAKAQTTTTIHIKVPFDSTKVQKKITVTGAGATLINSVLNVPGGTSLSGTGFVKATGSTISYDNSNYATTTQLGGKQDTSVKTKVARPLYVTIADSTLHSDTVSLSKAGVLKPGYVTNSGDTLATKSDARAGGGGGGGTTATPLNRVVWVDSLGNDATGRVGNILLPFQTIQRALDSTATGGTVNVGNGTFLLSAALLIKSNQSLKGSINTIVKKNSAFTHTIVNDACYRNDGTIDSNIVIDNISIDANSYGGSAGRASATANGNLQLTYAKNVKLSNIFITHNDAGVFSTHFQNVLNMTIKNISIISLKDGLHFNNGCRNIIVDGAYLDTHDDAIAILADDYPAYQNSADSIENITLQNITIDTLINSSPTGFAARILTGSWLAWANGNTYQIGNYVTNAGKIYKVNNSGTFTGSVAPTHTSGVVTGADGIAWRFLNTGSQLYTTVNNIKFLNVRINGERKIYRTINNDSFDYGVYPGTSGGIATGLYFTNVSTSSLTSITSIQQDATNVNAQITNSGATQFSTLFGNQTIQGGNLNIGTDQSISSSALNLSRNGGQILFRNLTRPTDEKLWDILPAFSQWNLRLLNDANSSSTNAINITRTGYALGTVNLGSNFQYDDVNKVTSLTGTGTNYPLSLISNQATGNGVSGFVLFAHNGTSVSAMGNMGVTNSTWNTGFGDYGQNGTFLKANNTGGLHFLATNASTGVIAFTTGGNTISNRRMTIDQNGKISIGNFAATAMFHLQAGTATAGTAPLKLTSGVNLTTPENGAVEYDGANYWVTSGGIRYLLSRSTTGTAAPTTTPAAVGLEFIDTTNKKIYKSTGTASSADWTILN
jgi:hypothetical protein